MSPAPKIEERVTGPSWADDFEDNDEVVPTGKASEEEDAAAGIKTIVEETTNEEGKKVRVTRRIRLKLVATKANHSVAERKKLKKFGDSAGSKPGPETSTTTLGDKVYLKLSHGIKAAEEQKTDIVKPLSTKANITCRFCKGPHFTAKCPYRDSHPPLDDLPPSESRESLPAADSGPSADDAGASKPGKYIPPGLRGKSAAAIAGESMNGPGRGRGDRDDLPTIRITNLSEDTTEMDLKDLVAKFGPTQRVFVARDRDLNICKGFAFVSYYVRDDAEKAMNALNGYGYDNLILKVEWARYII
ncbi:translation initiation factor eIF3g [Cladochytrium replicatum]|nr:translation initiation factor eIF3g [Cladochytrium replicatum]